VALCEAYNRRRKRELEAFGAMMATAQHKPKNLRKVVSVPPSRLHGGRSRGLQEAWWKRGADG
jgi:hypothetical protein